MKKILILFSLVLFVSCNDSKINKEKIINLPYTVLLEDEVLRNPRKMLVTDQYLVVSNLKTDTIIDIYSLEGKKISQFLKYGEGPNEALNIVGLQYLKKDNDLHIIDNFRNKTYSVNLRDVEGGNDIGILEVEIGLDKLSDKVAIKDWWKFLKNGKLISSSASPKGMLSCYDIKTGEITFYEEYPKLKGLDESAAIGLFQAECSVTPEGDKAVVVYYNSDIIGFVTLDNDLLTTRFIHSQLPNDIYLIPFDNGTVRGAFTGKSLRHFVNVTSCNKGVYALYCGFPEEECTPGSMRGRLVRCYNWNGDLLSTIDLGVDALQISVSSDNKYLYALESSEDGFRVLKYEL